MEAALSVVGALELQQFLLVLARSTTMIFIFPIFGSNQIPAYLKAGLSGMLALILTFAMPPALAAPLPAGYFILQVAFQVLIGLVIGYSAFVIFMGILLAGQIVDIEMGFAIANVIDPVSNIQQSLIGQFQNLLAFMFFIAMDGHHKLILVLSKSFDLVPLGRTPQFNNFMGTHLVTMYGSIFSLALRLAFPIIGAMFLTDLILGLLSRLIPQLNVFVLGFPIKLGLGMWVLMFVLGTFVLLYPDLFDDAILQLLELTRRLGKVA